MKIRKIKLREKTKNNIRKLRKEATPQERIVWARLKNRQFNNLKFRRNIFEDRGIFVNSPLIRPAKRDTFSRREKGTTKTIIEK